MSGVDGLVHLAGIFEPDPDSIANMGVYTGHPAHLTNGYMMAGAVMEKASRHASAMSLHRRWRSAVVRGARTLRGGQGRSGRDDARACRRHARPGESTVAPDRSETAMSEKLVASAARTVVAEIPLKRQVKPSEVASVMHSL
jgi:hypothetical protein